MNYRYWICSFMVFAIILINSAFTIKSERTFLEKQQHQCLDALAMLDQTIVDFQDALRSQDLERAVAIFHKARRIYKQQEFILEYFHHSTIKKFINGAPLPQIEQKVADLTIRPPQGFQHMEEILYSEEPIDWAALKLDAREFRQHLGSMTKYQRQIQFYDRHLLEAVRYELIRIYTLGLTGFETPGSDSALRESVYAFSALKYPVTYYAMQASPEDQQWCINTFNEGIAMLYNADFDDLDRLAFLREISDPLFKKTLTIHTTLGIETIAEVNTNPIATNYLASSLFDIELLNKDYFLQIPTNGISQAQIDLGKTLFFDPALSFNNSLSCSSCHQPEKAFTDGKNKSLSNDLVSKVERNAPTLINAIYSGAYFHDMRAGKIEMQAEHVMVNPKEFNTKPLELANKLISSSEYMTLFGSAFPGMDNPIQPRTVKSALAAYVSTLVSWNSPFDKYARGETDELSQSAINGYNIFMGKAACGTCHFAPNFNGIVPPFYDDTESEVLGVTATNDTLHPTPDSDLGRYDNGKHSEHSDHFKKSFKTPTVRNIALTGPYFHNGAYPTLEEVMWFYNKGGGQSLGLDVPNQTLSPEPLNLTQKEIEDVIAFMKSLTDVKSFSDKPSKLPDFDNIPELQDRTVANY